MGSQKRLQTLTQKSMKILLQNFLPIITALPLQSQSSTSSNFCLNHADGIYAFKNDCSKFLMCAGNQEFDYDCPSGLFFNPEILACDWAENVDCKDKDDGGDQIVTTETITTEIMTTEN